MAAPTRSTCFTASLFTVGSVPGCAMHTGQTFTLGFVSSGSLRELQNIFVCVFNSAWISRPIVVLYPAIRCSMQYQKGYEKYQGPNTKFQVVRKLAFWSLEFGSWHLFFESFS